jgi:hypothetical protein
VTDATMPAESMDDLSRIVMALVQEVWIMRDRMAVTEQLLAERINIRAADVDDYAGDASFKRDVETLRARFTAKVIGAPLAARERSVEQILSRAGLSPSASARR